MTDQVAVRRRPHDVHQRLLDAAERVFIRRGLAKATVTEISNEAGVSLSVLYRHFRSKTDLFREAILSPFLEFLQEWSRDIEGTQPRPSYEVTRTLIEMIFNRVGAHPEALSLLFASDVVLDTDSSEEVRRLVAEVLDSLSGLAAAEVRRNDMPGADSVGLHTRLTFGMVLSVLQWQPWLLGRDSPHDRDATIDSIAKLVWNGAALALGEVPARDTATST